MPKDRSLEGKRVRLIYCGDPHTRLMPGLEGTVALVDDAGTVHVRWDNGSRLGLVPEEDRFEIIGPEPAPAVNPEG